MLRLRVAGLRMMRVASTSSRGMGVESGGVAGMRWVSGGGRVRGEDGGGGKDDVAEQAYAAELEDASSFLDDLLEDEDEDELDGLPQETTSAAGSTLYNASHAAPGSQSALPGEEYVPYVHPETGEVGGPQGPEPTRFNDWSFKGRCTDF